MLDSNHLLLFLFVVSMMTICKVMSDTQGSHALCIFPSVFIKRNSNNKGFHRDIFSEISIDQTALGHKFCLLLVEHLPPDIYVDPYQLAHDHKFGGPKVIVYQEVNVETPASKSPPIDAFIFLCKENEWSQIMLPVHLRYQNPQICAEHGAFKTVTLQNPSVFARWLQNGTVSCENVLYAPCDFHDEKKCAWIPLKFSHDVEQLMFEVPVGCLEHYSIVSLVTIFTILCGIAAILYVLIYGKFYNNKKVE